MHASLIYLLLYLTINQYYQIIKIINLRTICLDFEFVKCDEKSQVKFIFLSFCLRWGKNSFHQSIRYLCDANVKTFQKIYVSIKKYVTSYTHNIYMLYVQLICTLSSSQIYIRIKYVRHLIYMLELMHDLPNDWLFLVSNLCFIFQILWGQIPGPMFPVVQICNMR